MLASIGHKPGNEQTLHHRNSLRHDGTARSGPFHLVIDTTLRFHVRAGAKQRPPFSRPDGPPTLRAFCSERGSLLSANSPERLACGRSALHPHPSGTVPNGWKTSGIDPGPGVVTNTRRG